MRQGRYAEVESGSAQLLERAAGSSALWRLNAGAKLLQGKDALPALTRASALLPQDAQLLFHLGVASHQAGDPVGAIDALSRALQLAPDLADTHDALGLAQLDAGRIDAALDSHRRAIALAPHSAPAHSNLGAALLAAGHAREAAASCLAALALDADHAQAHGNLGNACKELGDLDAAVRHYRRMLELRPDLAEAHNNLGNAYLAKGEFESAVTAYAAALALRPDAPGVLANLGNALRQTGRSLEALAPCRRALELEPNFADAHRFLGNAQFDVGQLDEAVASYRAALATEADHIDAHLALAKTLRQIGRTAEADASCRAALRSAPQSVEGLALLGEIAADQGQFDTALELTLKAQALDPDWPDAWANLARQRRMSSRDTAWLAQVTRLTARALPLGQQINLRYALGKYFDDTENYDGAFEEYRRANELQKRFGSPYDPGRLSRRVDAILARYSAAWLARTAGQASQRPIFVIGMPRTGTTLVEQVLASHPQAFGAGELRFWHAATARYEALTAPATGTDAAPALAASQYLQHIEGLADAGVHVIDKMPANFLNLGLIHAALPNARVIHVRRHPVDVGLSIYFQSFSNTHAYANDLNHIVHYTRQYRRLMQHWRALLPREALLEVTYEDLVREPQTTIRGMLAFLRLPWDARCLDFHRTERPVATASNWQVRQKMTTASVHRWRHYAPHIGVLTTLLETDETE